jgi:D-alanyl-D-alanine carboxypeptidase
MFIHARKYFRRSSRGTVRTLVKAGVIAALLSHGHASLAADLRGALQDVVSTFNLPGAVLLVSSPEGREIAVSGVENLVTRTPVTEKTRFHVASVGKVLTAIATLQLIDDHKLSLDDPILPYVEVPEANRLAHIEAATIRRLLSHTSGLPDCLRNGSFSVPQHPSIVWTADDVMRYAQCRPANTPETYVYSNTNYILLGYAIERIEGESLGKIFSRRIFTPLGMNDSTVGASPAEPHLAHGYRPADRSGVRKDASLLALSSKLGDAPLTTTAPDLERVFAALFRPGGPLLSAEMLKTMKTEWGHDEDEAYGLGLEIIDTDYGPRYGHSGRFAGYCAEAWYYADKDKIVVLVANGDEHTDKDVMETLEPWIFR